MDLALNNLQSWYAIKPTKPNRYFLHTSYIAYFRPSFFERVLEMFEVFTFKRKKIFYNIWGSNILVTYWFILQVRIIQAFQNRGHYGVHSEVIFLSVSWFHSYNSYCFLHWETRSVKLSPSLMCWSANMAKNLTHPRKKMYFWYISQNIPPQAGCETRWIFKLGTAGLD